MRKVLILFALLCSLTVYAQDVITKKDGNTIVCRVMEVNQTEVVYKKWSNLQGDNYVMNIADIASINYENGERKTFGDASQETVGANISQVASNAAPQYMSDAALLGMVNYPKIKSTRLRACIGGGVLLIAGTAGLIWAMDPYGPSETLGVISIGTMVAGATWTTVGLIKANRMKRKYENAIYSTAILQHEFKLNNNSSLSAQLCSIKENLNHTSTIGVGVKYNF